MEQQQWIFSNSHGIAIYYPHIKVRDPNWLKCSLLYFDSIKRIIPNNYDPAIDDQADPEVELAIAAGAIVDTQVSDQRAKSAEQRFTSTVLTTANSSEAANRFKHAIAATTSNQNATNIDQLHRIVQSLKTSGDGYLVDMWDGKMSPSLRDVMEECGVAQLQDGFLYVDKAVADIYMSCLATVIAEELSYPLVTDNVQFTDVGRFVRFSTDNNETVDKTQQIAELKVDFPTPPAFSQVSMQRIIDFREKHREERKRFRVAIEALLGAGQDLTNAEARADFLATHAREIKDAVEEQRRSLSELSAVGLNEALKISAPAFLSGGLGGLIAAPLVPVFAAAGLSLSVYAWWTEMQSKQRVQERSCPWQYLISMQEEVLPLS